MSVDEPGSMSSMDEGGAQSQALPGPRRSSRATSAAVVAANKEKKTKSQSYEDISAMAAGSSAVVSGLRDGKEDETRLGKAPPTLPPPAPRSLEEMEEERKKIRSMWELASFFDFIRLFDDHILKLSIQFTAEELENAILTPIVNSVLRDLHISLLRQIHPPSRPLADKVTWATALTKKLSNNWTKLAEGECPLTVAQGEEESVYTHLSPTDRVRVLKALCELRLDQEDCHNYVDTTLKHGVTIDAFRLEPFGKDSNGCIYWQLDGGDVGHRMYKETPHMFGKGKRATGRRAAVPVPGNWETVASNLAEFQELAEKLTAGRQKADVKIGRDISNNIVPLLEELERKRERQLKKQQRQALQLYEAWGGPGLAAGRSRRERKVVNYTFDEYDRSIMDAIKVTRKGKLDQLPPSQEGPSRENPSTTGGPSDSEQNGHMGLSSSPQDHKVNGEELVHSSSTVARSGRISRKPSRLVQSSLVSSKGEFGDSGNSTSGSDEEIEGEVEFTEEYKRAHRDKKRRKEEEDEKDEEYMGEEEDQDEEEEDGMGRENEDNDLFDPFEDEEFGRKAKRVKSSKATRAGGEGGGHTRRSSRATKSHINYRQLDGGLDNDWASEDEEERERGVVTRGGGGTAVDTSEWGENSEKEEKAAVMDNHREGEREGQAHPMKERPSKPRSHGRPRSARMKPLPENENGKGEDDEREEENVGGREEKQWRTADSNHDTSSREDAVDRDIVGGKRERETDTVEREGEAEAEYSEDDGDAYFSNGGGQVPIMGAEREEGEKRDSGDG